MATKVYVNGKTITRPGVYAFMISGIKTTPASLPFGHVAILDTGIGAGYGGGSGTKAYEFDTVQGLQNFVKGGPLFDLAQQLFSPIKGIKGASKVSLVQAREDSPATLTITFEHGTLTLTTVDRGVNANGVIVNNVLLKGYGLQILSKNGTVKIQLTHGTATGIDPLNNIPYNNNIDPKPAVIVESPYFTSIDALQKWMISDPTFNAGITVTSFTATGANGSSDITANDITNHIAVLPFSGATETYTPAAYAASLATMDTLKNEFILATKCGVDAQNSENQDLLGLCRTAKYDKYVVIGGGATAIELDSISIPAAKAYNTEKVIVVHGDGEVANGNGYKKLSSLSKAANWLGRLCGIDPENPMTLKKMGIDRESNSLTDEQLERGLNSGVTLTYNDDELGYIVCLEAVNTLQDNNNLVNENAASFDVGVERIKAQVNKEATIYLKRKFYGGETGGNRLSLNADDVTSAVDGFLNGKVKDGLIVRYGNITLSVQGDVYYVSYEFVPNFPVNKVIVTGTILDK